MNLRPDTMVVTSTYVINDKMPVLYISNDKDEEEGSIWQFHCGNGDFDMKKMLLVTLDTILSLDNELGKLNLKIGEEAIRESKDLPWRINEQK